MGFWKAFLAIFDRACEIKEEEDRRQVCQPDFLLFRGGGFEQPYTGYSFTAAFIRAWLEDEPAAK